MFQSEIAFFVQTDILGHLLAHLIQCPLGRIVGGEYLRHLI